MTSPILHLVYIANRDAAYVVDRIEQVGSGSLVVGESFLQVGRVGCPLGGNLSANRRTGGLKGE